jgi:hypothetical protein
MKRNILCIAAMALVAMGCGGTASEATGSVTVSTIEALPKATDRVEVTSSTNISKSLLKAASTGLPLGTTTSSSFDSSSSIASCEMFNMTKSAVQSAAQGDLILCYIQGLFKAAVAAGITDTNGSAIDIYDGNTHTFTLDLTGVSTGEDDDDGGGPDHVKNSGGAITDFKMWACESSSQNEYISQTIADSTFTMKSISKHRGSDGKNTINETAQIDVSGTLNSSGKFTGTKNITLTIDAGSSWWGIMTFGQQASSATMTAYQSGTFSDPQSSATITSTNSIYGTVQLLDGNATDADPYKIALLALGDGAVKGEWTGTRGSEIWNDTFVQSWNGDTATSVSSNDYTEAATAATLTTKTEPTVAFSGDEAYDCSGTAEATISFATLSASGSLSKASVDLAGQCGHLQLSHSWLDCWTNVGKD